MNLPECHAHPQLPMRHSPTLTPNPLDPDHGLSTSDVPSATQRIVDAITTAIVELSLIHI